MKRPRFYVAATAVSISVALAGCDGQTVAPPSDGPPASAVVRSGAPSLLYVLDSYRSRDLSVFALPHGNPRKAVVMPGYGEGGMCSDSRGHVFVAADDAVFKYAHGGKTPIAELIASSQPMNCSSDPKTGNLAVTEFPKGSSGECTIAIYRDAKGSATTLYDPAFTDCNYPTYDDRGDLFFDGLTNSKSILTELPAGSAKYVPITLNRSFPRIDLMQWDGHDLAIASRELGSVDQPVVIYRTHIDGSKGTVVAKILFKGWTPGEGTFWIQGDQMFAPLGDTHSLGVWKYPQGGQALDTFSSPNGTYALTVSVAP
jgi:hypothetical protein